MKFFIPYEHYIMDFNDFRTLNESKQHELFELLNLNEETKIIFEEFKNKQDLLLLKRKNKLYELFGIKYRKKNWNYEKLEQYLKLDDNKKSWFIKEDIMDYARKNNLWIDNDTFKLDENLKLIFDTDEEEINLDESCYERSYAPEHFDIFDDVECLYDYF